MTEQDYYEIAEAAVPALSMDWNALTPDQKARWVSAVRDLENPRVPAQTAMEQAIRAVMERRAAAPEPVVAPEIIAPVVSENPQSEPVVAPEPGAAKAPSKKK